MTINDCIEVFILEQQLKGNTPKTIENYSEFLKRFSSYYENMNIEDMTIKHINKYHLYLRSTGITAISIKTYLRHLKVFFRFLYNKEFIKTPIHIDIILPKAEKPQIEILTDEEIKILLSQFSQKSMLGLRNTAICMLMLDAGLRKAEVEGLLIRNIRFDKNYLIVTGKGRKDRIVPLGLVAKRALLNYLYKRKARNIECEYFFLNKTGERMEKECIKNLFRRLKIKTGIVRIHPHLLRHTFATNFLLNSLGDVYELSRILGHEDIKTTEIYLNIASYYKIIQKKKKLSYLDTFIH